MKSSFLASVTLACNLVACDNGPTPPVPDTVIRNEIVFAAETPDGAFAHILRIKPDGTSPQYVTDGPVRDAYPSVAPDGRLIAFVRIARTNDLHVMNADGTNLRRLTVDSIQYLTGLSWSPDGSKIVFSGQNESNRNQDIYVVEVATGQVVNITQNILNPTRSIYLDPDWGTTNEIVFSKNDTLYWITPNGQFLRKQAFAGKAIQPKWSPGGEQIVFTYIDVSVLPARVNLGMIDADGANLHFLTDEATISADPAWSPTGEEIAFRSHRDGQVDIFVLRVSNPQVLRNVSRRAGHDYGPSWR